jgi:hypothetical protein
VVSMDDIQGEEKRYFGGALLNSDFLQLVESLRIIEPQDGTNPTCSDKIFNILPGEKIGTTNLGELTNFLSEAHPSQERLNAVGDLRFGWNGCGRPCLIIVHNISFEV